MMDCVACRPKWYGNLTAVAGLSLGYELIMSTIRS